MKLPWDKYPQALVRHFAKISLWRQMAAAKSSFLFVRVDEFEGAEDRASLQTLEDHAVGLMNSAG